MGYYEELRDEINSDPLARGYVSMTDAEVAASLNVKDRPGEPDGSALLRYMLTETYRGGTLFGRVNIVANASILRAGNSWEFPPFPLGDADGEVVPTFAQVASAATFMRILDTDIIETIVLVDADIGPVLTDLGPSGCQCFAQNNIDDIEDFSNNAQTRAQELGWGPVKEAHVAYARSL